MLVTATKAGKAHRWRAIAGTSVSTVTRCVRMPIHYDATAGKRTARTAVTSAASAEKPSSELRTSRLEASTGHVSCGGSLFNANVHANDESLCRFL